MNKEKREYVLARDNYTCQHCGATPGYSRLQIAHKLGDHKRAMQHIEIFLFVNYEKVLTKKSIQDNIIDSPLDLVTTCAGACNDAQNIFFKPIARDKLLREIIEGQGIRCLLSYRKKGIT